MYKNPADGAKEARYPVPFDQDAQLGKAKVSKEMGSVLTITRNGRPVWPAHRQYFITPSHSSPFPLYCTCYIVVISHLGS